MSQNLLKKLNIPAFRPLLFCNTGKRQTLAAFIYPRLARVNNNHQHFLKLPDGDTIALTENRPTQWSPTQRTLVLVHGLTGSHRTRYMIRLTRLFMHLGYQVIRLDLRGCGAGRGLAKHPYHGGKSEDPRYVMQWLAQLYPHSPVTLIGFSLGANIILKMAGEDADKPSGNLDSIIAVSPPIDLYASVQRILLPHNRLFERYFVNELLRDIKTRKHHSAEIQNFPAKLNLLQFDDHYTAPLCGFHSAIDYYQQSSAAQYIPNITLPTLILHAKDDPVVCHAAFDHLPRMVNLDLLISEQGGHVGWVGPTGDFYRYGHQWMDRVLVEWVKLHASHVMR